MRGREAARLAAGSAVVIASTAIARSRVVHPAEHDTFRLVNDLPESLAVPTTIVMQAGSLPAVFVAAGVAHRLDHRRLAAVTAVTGTAVWAGCKVMKQWVGRGRPTDHVDDVRQRGRTQAGLGFPSGHAAVAATLATLLAPEVPRLLRPALAATATLTALARLYVGAHLPLDILAGTALGLTTATAARALSVQ